MVFQERSWKLAAVSLSALWLAAMGMSEQALAQGAPDGSSPPGDNARPNDGSNDTPGDPPGDVGAPKPDTRPWAQGVSKADQARANELFEAGDALLREFQLAEAMQSYRQALEHWQHPAIHFRVASILFSQGRLVEAYKENEKALRHDEAPLGKQFYQGARNYKSQLEQTLVWLTVVCDEAGAEVRLDGEVLFTGPGKAENLIVMPGAHTLVATKEGMIPATQNLSLERGSRPVETLALQRIAAKEKFYPTVGRLGFAAHGLFDVEGVNTSGEGIAALVGVSYGLLSNLDLAAGAVVSGSPGIYASATLFLRKGLWRPTLGLGLTALRAPANADNMEEASFQPGARAAVGLEYTPTASLGIVFQAGVEFYPRATVRRVSFLFAPTIGLQYRM